MPYFPARWTTSLAAAALATLPLTVAAQTQYSKESPKQEIKQEMKIDAAASKMHLSAARDTLSQLTSMPEAARLQGDGTDEPGGVQRGGPQVPHRAPRLLQR